MILDIINSNILNDGGFYYTPSFNIESKDALLTAAIVLSANGTASFQSSIEDINWFDVSDTDITCNPSGLQSFAECQYGLYYRIKSSVDIISVKVLI